jgi:hypothetical protein
VLFIARCTCKEVFGILFAPFLFFWDSFHVSINLCLLPSSSSWCLLPFKSFLTSNLGDPLQSMILLQCGCLCATLELCNLIVMSKDWCLGWDFVFSYLCALENNGTLGSGCVFGFDMRSSEACWNILTWDRKDDFLLVIRLLEGAEWQENLLISPWHLWKVTGPNQLVTKWVKEIFFIGIVMKIWLDWTWCCWSFNPSNPF